MRTTLLCLLLGVGAGCGPETTPGEVHERTPSAPPAVNTPELDRAAARSPRIDAIDVGIDRAGLAKLSARAIDLGGRPLVYKWGSRLLDPPVLTGSAVSLDARDPEPGTLTAHLAVQDAGGKLVAGKVTFYRDAICAVCGERRVELATPLPEDEPCVNTHQACIAGCEVLSTEPRTIEPVCGAECAALFALCRTNPS